MEKRTNLYAEGDFEGIDKLEKELLAQNAEQDVYKRQISICAFLMQINCLYKTKFFCIFIHKLSQRASSPPA